MPNFTSSGSWTSPSSGTVTFTIEAGGGHGGDYDPVQETPGGGGGQGGAITLTNMAVQQGEEFVISVYSNQVIVSRRTNSGDMIMAMNGSSANNSWGGPGGYTSSSGFSGQSISGQTGASGQNALNNGNGGNGGGSPGNHGTPTTSAMAGFPPRGGGGGQGLNGPGSGASGGASLVTVTFTDGLPPQ